MDGRTRVPTPAIASATLILSFLIGSLVTPAPAIGEQQDTTAPGSGAEGTELVTFEGPPVVLAGVGTSVTIRSAEGADPVDVRLLTGDGRVLRQATLAPGDEITFDDVVLDAEGDLPLRLESGGEEVGRADPPLLPGWASLLPPLVAIALALIFREVVISLFAGVWLGAFFITGLDPLAGLWRTIDRFAVPALADTGAGHPQIIVFSLLLGGMVGVAARSGGTRGIVEAVEPLATSPRRAQLAAYLGGLAIFFDDYANTLIVGNTFRPITDRMKVSREKLAYIVDSTAAPVASIVFVSTWVGFEISLIADGLALAANQPEVTAAAAESLQNASAFNVFMESIAFRFYPILALIMVGLVIWTQRDFGPMWEAENRASRGDGLYREDAMLTADTSGEAMEAKEGAPARWWNAALPVLTVVVVVLLGLYFDGRSSAGPGASLWATIGEADPFAALLWGSLAGCMVAMGLAISQRILSVQESVDAMVGGMRAMLLAILILILAWSLGAVTEVLGTADYLSNLLSGNLPIVLLPVVTFVTAAAISFATGTSWGTMAILIPLVIPLTVSLSGGGFAPEGDGGHYTVLLGVISSVLAGAIWGDHCSPISDTTVLSSMASACDHVDHVRTQLPYALLVGGVGMAVGDVPTAFGMSPWISYGMGGAILFLVLRYLGRRDDESPQWAEGAGSG